MATPAATATALHGNPTECYGDPYGTPMFTVPRLGSGLGFGCHGMPLEVRRRIGGMPRKMPRKVLLQVVSRHACREKGRYCTPPPPSSGIKG